MERLKMKKEDKDFLILEIAKSGLIKKDGLIYSGDLKDFIDQLEEPQQEKVVVPQFVADWIEGNKQEEEAWENYNAESALNDSIHFTIYGLFANYPTTNTHVELRKPTLEWLNNDRGNYFKLVEAVKYGYTFEKEKLYRVKIFGNLCLRKSTEGEGNIAIGSGRLSDGFTDKLTEKEIKSIDERYWPFAEEVTE